MTVVYFTPYRLPDGAMASSNRVMHLARALVAGDAHVIALTPSSPTGSRGRYYSDGVEIQALCDAPRSWLERQINAFLLFPLRALSLLWKIRGDVVLYVYTTQIHLMCWAYLLSMLRKCPLVAEVCEYPCSVLTNRLWIVQWFESRVVPLFYNGVVCISENLRDYYAKRTRRSCLSIVIPMTVDCEPFANACGNSILDFDYIAYTGSMRREGGGVDVLVKVFAMVAIKHPELHLVLIGDGTEELRSQFLGLAGSAADRVHCIFGGQVPRGDMPRYIANAKILAMLPLPTFQQQGCFPTKLGEYLSSGVPAVITKVGNPVAYLTDGENIFYVPPNDVRATVAKIEEILTDYPKAQSVGKKGQQFAREHFNYANCTDRLKEFYDSIERLD